MVYVGIDWGSDQHQIAVVDEHGEELKNFAIPHQAEGIETLLNLALELAPDKSGICFAIETSQHVLVDVLLEAGYPVYPINPKQSERARENYSVAGAKSDKSDALVLARFLKNDHGCLRPFKPSSEPARELRLLTRDRQTLVAFRTQLVNQLISCLKAYYPRALELFSQPDSNIFLAFLREFPTPEDAQKVTVVRFTTFLKRNSYPGMAKAGMIHEKLHRPQLPVEPFVIKAKSKLMASLVVQLSSLNDQLKQYDQSIAELFEQHPDSNIFRSLPGSGGSTIPRLLAEMGDCRENFPDATALQCQAGTAPVTKASGHSHYVQFRYACNKHLRDAVHNLSFASLKQCLWAREYYKRKMRQGKRHAAALRMLGNIWLKIIHSMWCNHTLYDEKLFLASRAKHSLLTHSLT